MGEPWLLGLFLTIAIGLIGIIYRAGQTRDDKQDARAEKNEKDFDDHVKDSRTIHERVVRLETKVEAVQLEVSKLRDMRHGITEDVTRALASWYTDIMDQVHKLIDQVRK